MEQAGRPRIGERVALRLPDEMLADIDRRAAVAGVSRAEAVRALLRRALALGHDYGVDRTQIRRRLALTPAQRLSVMTEEVRQLVALRGTE